VRNARTEIGCDASPANRRVDRGNCSVSAIDPRQLFKLSAVIESPRFTNPALQRLASGWRLSPILRKRTGSYLTVTTSTDVALNGIGNQRVSQVMANVYGD